VALVQAEQARTGRLLLDDNGHVFEAPPEALWNIAESRFNQAIEFGSGQHASSSYSSLPKDPVGKSIIAQRQRPPSYCERRYSRVASDPILRNARFPGPDIFLHLLR
jgi:hypothetical protein